MAWLKYMAINILYNWDSTAPGMSDCIYLELYSVRSVKIGMCAVLHLEG